MSEWTNEIKREGWYWIRGLPADAPPQCVRLFLRYDEGGEFYSGTWEYWGVGGWVTIPAVACVCWCGDRPRRASEAWGSPQRAGWHWIETREEPVKIELRGGEWREWGSRGGWVRLARQVAPLASRPED